MLTELVILAVLLDESCTIYKLKKKIDEKFSLIYKPGIGSIHSMLKKFEQTKYVNVKKSVSAGGQRRSVYSITAKGKKYFEEVMMDSEMSEQILKVKLLLLSKMEKSQRVSIINNVRDYYREKRLDFENYYENHPESYIKHCIHIITEEINWLSRQELL